MRQKKRKSTKKKTTRNGHADLISELFQSAIKLRGSIDAPEYKRYVLPLIFLRFLSLRYEKRRAALEEMLDNKDSDYFTEDKKQREVILEDPDEYRAKGAFIIPEKARWSYLLKHAQDDDIKLKVDQALEALEDAYPEQLRGLLPRIFAGSNIEPHNLTGLINLFSKDVFKSDHDGLDLLGRIYEYFIGEFADSEGKRGGEYFTPVSIVKTLVHMLEPKEGIVFDPCCGSGGMFVQSDIFTKHNHKLSFYGQESKDFTLRLCKMSLFIHDLEGKIEIGNSYTNDRHPDLKADYVLANPPFNDGAKGEDGWGADRVSDQDLRLRIGDDKMPLAARNANTMWMLHFLHHLKEGGTAGFVMATGELSNSETARLAVRKALVEGNYVDCIVQLSGQLFANTQIPCCLWFLSKNREGSHGFRDREGKILFIDGRNLGRLIPESRKQKQLSDEEIEQIASIYRQFRVSSEPEEILGFCRVATLKEVKNQNYALTPGRYVGSEEIEEDSEPFEDKFPKLASKLEHQFSESVRLQKTIRKSLKELLDV